mgnify:CR=1 FL=1
MIEYASGDILEADAQALVNSVNCVGVMGKGIALQFKLKYPENFRAYAKICKKGALEPGRVFVFDRGSLFDADRVPQHIINFPTKTHWSKPSKLEYIEEGMQALAREVKERGIASVAIPPLGCGNGGLEWSRVEAIIHQHMGALSDTRVVLYPPGHGPRGPSADARANARRKRPAMTQGRALVIKLIASYQELGYRHGMREVQKLAYLLQTAGHDLRLDYRATHYGPRAGTLGLVLKRMEGHFTEGYKGTERHEEDEQPSEINVLPGALENAEKQIEADESAKKRLVCVQDLMAGFETPFGMELLTTVLWVARNTPKPSANVHQVASAVHSWNQRKQELFTHEHIRVAWERLRNQGWLEEAL